MSTIAEKLKYLLETKELIKEAVNAKGGSLTSEDTFRSYANAVENLETGTGSTKYNITIDSILGDVDDDGVLQSPSAAGDLIFTDVKDISDNAMYYLFRCNTSITSVSFPALTSVSGSNAMYYAFSDCTSLTDVSFPELTTVSGSSCMYYVFYNCTGLTSVSFPALTTVSGFSALYYAFYYCTGLTSVSFPALATISGSYGMYYVFYNCTSLTTVSFPVLTSVGANGMNYAFSGCTGLTSVSFPKLETIDKNGMYYAFYNCSLTSISFPSLTSIGQNAFRNCTSLTKIWIPSTVTDISASSYSYSPFYSCSSNLVIYTDIASEDDIPSGWGTYWNYYGSGKTLTVVYGASEEDFENA